MLKRPPNMIAPRFEATPFIAARTSKKNMAGEAYVVSKAKEVVLD